MLGLGIGSAIAIGAEVLDLALSGVKASKSSAADVAPLDQIRKNQFRIPAGSGDNDPSNIYATVKVNGDVVATIYNSGAVASSNGAAARLRDLPSMTEGEFRSGPKLAQARAQEIAEALGGKIVRADTAQTQGEWESRLPLQVTYDPEATERATQARDFGTHVLRSANDRAERLKPVMARLVPAIHVLFF